MVYYYIIQIQDIHVYNVDMSDWDKTRHVVQSYKPTGYCIMVNTLLLYYTGTRYTCV